MDPMTPRKIEDLVAKLSLQEKVALLTGSGRCAFTGIETHGIPSLNTSDGPHGLRGYNFFNVRPSCQLPSATAMGATFDIELLHRAGNLIGDEALARNIHVVLAPTVCLQRSPLLGRAFEAFAEDPVLSGTLGGQYINGIQERQVGACIKHYAAHDQSDNSVEDNVQMTKRTLRELHLLPFQIAQKNSHPWAFMTSYNKINGIHASEDPFLIDQILRKEWRFDGLVMSDWWGTYSTSEAMNAGLDIEMPGPSVWRGQALASAVNSRKVSKETVDSAVRNVLKLVSRAYRAPLPVKDQKFDTPESRALTRKLAADSIVLLKNERGVLPLDPTAKKTYAFIGDHFKNPATGGGGSSEANPYYTSTPFDAMTEQIGLENVECRVGCYSHRFLPLIYSELQQPSGKPGLYVELFAENFEEIRDAKCLWTAETTKSLLQFTDSIPLHLPKSHFIRIRTTFTAEKSAKYRFGLSAFGKVRMKIDGKEVIDLWTDHPKKTDTTPVFNAFSMQRFHDIDLVKGQRYNIDIILSNVITGNIVGAAPAGGIRLGGCEVLDEDQSIWDAVALAKRVDYPIIMTGLSSDYEMESADRKDLKLPGRVDELIERVAEANPNTIVITQAGMPVTMPWVNKVNTLAHAWYGGQECGHGLADVLFGTVNPSGRLSVTFPKRLEDTPAFLNFGKSDRHILYGEGVFIGYRYYEWHKTPPLFYFGHGLSYTKFEYSNLVVPAKFGANPEQLAEISVDVSNAGELAGAEVIQVYISDLDSSIQRPKKELKAFSKINLAKGQKQTCCIKLDKYALSFWSEEHSKWRAEAGTFKIIIAKSADPTDELLEKEIELDETFMWSGL